MTYEKRKRVLKIFKKFFKKEKIVIERKVHVCSSKRKKSVFKK